MTRLASPDGGGGVYLYAVLERGTRGALGKGLAGEPIRKREMLDVVLAIGEMRAAPAVDAAKLRAHDAIVRRLAARSDAILPARFGSFAATEDVLRERLEPRRTALLAALARVAGREQMTLRVYGELSREAESIEPSGALDVAATRDMGDGPGARYLALRRHALAEDPELRALAPLRAALADIVCGEHVELHATPPLYASLYHLIARGRSEAYAKAARRAVASLGIRASLSGPWPPYAFAAEATP